MNGEKKRIRKQENKNLSKHIIIKKRFINKKNVNLQKFIQAYYHKEKIYQQKER
jgi:hypothetical protein